MQLYARIFNLSEKNRTTLITFHGHDHPYVFPSSSRYPFSVIEINAQLGLIYLKLKLKKKKSSQSLSLYLSSFLQTFFFPLRNFLLLFPNVSSVMFYDQKDIGVLSSLSFIPLSLGYFQRSLSCGDCNEKTGQEGQTGRAHVLLFSFCYKNTIPMHPRSQNFRTGRFNRYVVRLQLLNPECSKGELNQF